MKRLDDMHEKTFARIVWFFTILFFVFCCWLFLSGCSMSKTAAAKKIAKVETQQPEVLYNYCATKFPPLIIDSTHTEYIKGATAWRYDTVTIDCDSVIRGNFPQKGNKTPYSGKKQGENSLIFRIPCPPCPISVDTFKYYKLQAQENGAKVSALTIERDNAILYGEKQKQGRKIWMWIAIGLMAYTVIRWVLKAWLKITLP